MSLPTENPALIPANADWVRHTLRRVLTQVIHHRALILSIASATLYVCLTASAGLFYSRLGATQLQSPSSYIQLLATSTPGAIITAAIVGGQMGLFVLILVPLLFWPSVRRSMSLPTNLHDSAWDEPDEDWMVAKLLATGMNPKGICRLNVQDLNIRRRRVRLRLQRLPHPGTKLYLSRKEIERLARYSSKLTGGPLVEHGAGQRLTSDDVAAITSRLLARNAAYNRALADLAQKPSFNMWLRSKPTATRRRFVAISLAMLILIFGPPVALLVTIPKAAGSAADSVLAGHIPRNTTVESVLNGVPLPSLLRDITVLNLEAHPVTARPLVVTKDPIGVDPCLMLLGQSGETAILYDVETRSSFRLDTRQWALTFLPAPLPECQQSAVESVFVVDATHPGSETGGASALVTSTVTPSIPLDGTSTESQPAWAPSGAMLTLTSNWTGTFHLYTVDLVSHQAVQITSGPGQEFTPDWSKTLGIIAFTSASGTSTESISTVKPDGTSRQTVVQGGGAGGNNGFPVWSPTGAGMIFTSDRAGKGKWDLYLLSNDLKQVGRLTSHSSPDPLRAVWSPDSKMVAYSCRCGRRKLGIEILSLETNKEERLPSGDYDEGSPAWSPDGTRVAFLGNQDKYVQLYVMSADGHGAQRVARTVDLGASAPAWSPDGRVLAVTH
jgi:Tol biopolymer transport system component